VAALASVSKAKSCARESTLAFEFTVKRALAQNHVSAYEQPRYRCLTTKRIIIAQKTIGTHHSITPMAVWIGFARRETCLAKTSPVVEMKLVQGVASRESSPIRSNVVFSIVCTRWRSKIRAPELGRLGTPSSVVDDDYYYGIVC